MQVYTSTRGGVGRETAARTQAASSKFAWGLGTKPTDRMIWAKLSPCVRHQRTCSIAMLIGSSEVSEPCKRRAPKRRCTLADDCLAKSIVISGPFGAGRADHGVKATRFGEGGRASETTQSPNPQGGLSERPRPAPTRLTPRLPSAL